MKYTSCIHFYNRYHFKLDKYYARGPHASLHLVGAFSSMNESDIIELHAIFKAMLKQSPDEGSLYFGAQSDTYSECLKIPYCFSHAMWILFLLLFCVLYSFKWNPCNAWLFLFFSCYQVRIPVVIHIVMGTTAQPLLVIKKSNIMENIMRSAVGWMYEVTMN